MAALGGGRVWTHTHGRIRMARSAGASGAGTADTTLALCATRHRTAHGSRPTRASRSVRAPRVSRAPLFTTQLLWLYTIAYCRPQYPRGQFVYLRFSLLLLLIINFLKINLSGTQRSATSARGGSGARLGAQLPSAALGHATRSVRSRVSADGSRLDALKCSLYHAAGTRSRSAHRLYRHASADCGTPNLVL